MQRYFRVAVYSWIPHNHITIAVDMFRYQSHLGNAWAVQHLLVNSGGVCQRDRIGRTTLSGIRVEKGISPRSISPALPASQR